NTRQLRSVPSTRWPECCDSASAKPPAANNAHSPGGRGSGLAQDVFCSPARSSYRAPVQRPVRRAAKQKTLYLIVHQKSASEKTNYVNDLGCEQVLIELAAE